VQGPIYTFEAFRLDAQHRVLFRTGGDSIPLAPKVFDTLLYFVEHAGELLDKRTLLEAIWPHVVVEENNLNQSISTLRRVLGERPGEHRFIVTDPGRGYRFVASVAQRQPMDGYEPTVTKPAHREAANALATVIAEAKPPPPPTVALDKWLRRAAGVTVLAALVALAGLAGWSIANHFDRDTSAGVIRLSIPVVGVMRRESLGARHIAISEDGSRVAWATGRQLSIRHLSVWTPVVLDRSTANLFFSPDGRWLGFVENDALMKVRTSGGTPELIAATTEKSAGATWGHDGTIVFATTRGLYRGSESGGEPELLVRPDPSRNERLYAWPELMPDGHSVLFTVIPEDSNDALRIAALNLETRESKVVLNDGAAARYAATGHLLYVSGQNLNAIAFDRDALETRGDAVVMPDTAMAADADSGAAEFAVSATGTLILLTPRAARVRPLSWLGRQGGVEEPLVPPADYTYPRISPDGTRVAVDMFKDGNRDIWIWDVERQFWTARLTTGSAEDMMPLWAPDSTRVFFASNREGTYDIYSQAADGADEARLEFAGEKREMPISFAGPDVTRIVVSEDMRDLSVLDLARPDRLEPLLHDESHHQLGEVSPDGHWIAYESDESGKVEIYLRPFPEGGAPREKISLDGGRYPRWSRRGSDDLFYVTPGGAMMAAHVQLTPSLKIGRVEKLFDWVRPPTFASGNPYDVSRDGRFLAVTNAPDANDFGNISVALDWFEELRELLPQQ